MTVLIRFNDDTW